MIRTPAAALLLLASFAAHADLDRPYPLTNTRCSTTPRVIAASVATDGQSFVVAMRTPHDAGRGLHRRAARLPRGSRARRRTDLRRRCTAPGAASRGLGRRALRHHLAGGHRPLAYVDTAGGLTPEVAFEVGLTFGEPIPVQLGVGQLGIFNTRFAPEAPFHGSERLFLRWADLHSAAQAPALTRIRAWSRAGLSPYSNEKGGLRLAASPRNPVKRLLLLLLFVAASGAARADLDHPYALTSTRYAADGTAAKQSRMAAASGRNEIFIAWIEEIGAVRSLRAGIAGADGSWTEIGELSNAAAEGIDAPVAVSNGNGYLVVGRLTDGYVAYRISRGGELLGATEMPPLFTRIAGAAWNGSVYAMVGSTLAAPGGAIHVARMTADGASVEPVIRLVPPGGPTFTYSTAAIASDGESFLVAYDFSRSCVQCRRIHVVRLSGTLQPFGAGIDIDNFASGVADIAWSGTEYLLTAWGTGTRAIRIAPNGAPLGVHTIATSGLPRPVWTGTRYAIVGPGTLTYVDNAGNAGPTLRFTPPPEATAATASPGRLAIVTSQVAHDPPHYGAQRLFIRWVDAFAIPSPPRITGVEETRGTIALRWDRADLAGGYRIEMSVDEGPWREIEQLFDADDGSAEIPKRPGRLRFRMRAWSTGGMSAYSNEEAIDISPRARGVR